MKKYLLLLCIVSLMFDFTEAKAHYEIKMHHLSLKSAILYLAQLLHTNIVMDPEINGEVTLHLKHVPPEQVLQFLITTHNLILIKKSNIWYISNRSTWFKHQEEEKKQLDLRLATAPLGMHFWKIKHATATDIARLIKNEHHSLLSKRGQVTVDIRTNTISVQDVDWHIQQIKRSIKQWDEPMAQILIEARIVSIDHDFERNLGIQMISAQSDTHRDNAALTSKITTSFNIPVAKLTDHTLLDLKLSALEHAGHAELLSSPSLLAANLKTAVIEAGEEIPYQEVSESGGTALTFKKAVLGLKVTPQVLGDKQILLHLQINQDRPSLHSGMEMPSISTRQIVTHLRVKSGETVILGGIYEKSQEKTAEGFPYLNKIPLLHFLFNRQSHKKSKRELLIIVTPTIMS